MIESEVNISQLFPNAEVIGTEKYVAPRLAPELYPGETPEAMSSLMVGDRLQEMQFDPGRGEFQVEALGGTKSLDEVLGQLGAPGMVDRFPVTVFGSNRNPGQLLDKFKPKEGESKGSELGVLPMARGTLKGFDVVYNSKAGNLGYFFADLYQGPETVETEIEVSVLFATAEQLQRIHDSELAYGYTLLGDVEVGRVPGDKDKAVTTLPVFAHVGKAQVYAQSDGKAKHPVALEEVTATGRNLLAKSQTGIQDMFFAHDPDGLKRKALIDASGDEKIEPNGVNYRAHMKMARAGGLHELPERKLFQQALIVATTDDERLAIDPESFEVRTKIDLEKDILPAMGHIAVIKALSGR